MLVLAFYFGWALGVLIVVESAHWWVVGGFIKEKELDAYFSKYLPYSKLNPYSNTLLTDMPKYTARSQSPLSKWYIQDYGSIPRWSKWSKRLDARRKSLLQFQPPEPKAPLSKL